MTTYNHSVTATQIIRDALLLCGGVGENESVSGTATTDALRNLNNMVKGWQNHGYHLWTKKRVTLFLVPSQQSYLLGSSDTDAHWAESFTSTLLNGAASSGATSITVDSTTGMTRGDFIGIELSDGTRQWSNIKTVTSTTVVALDDALTGAASDNATVFVYTSRPQRPLRILHTTRGPYNGSEIPIVNEAFETYLDSPNKTSTGAITMISYQPIIPSGKLYVWLTSANCTDILRMMVEHPVGDFDAASDNPDFPIEWAETLIYNLAVRLEPQYRQLSAGRRQELRDDAAMKLAQSSMFDSDVGSIYFQA